ncbi:hypothetical protein SRHO_G00263270 [Serrasalmus rhombeus]
MGNATERKQMFGLETGVAMNADASTALQAPMATSDLRLNPHFQQKPQSHLSKANSSAHSRQVDRYHELAFTGSQKGNNEDITHQVCPSASLASIVCAVGLAGAS